MTQQEKVALVIKLIVWGVIVLLLSLIVIIFAPRWKKSFDTWREGRSKPSVQSESTFTLPLFGPQSVILTKAGQMVEFYPKGYRFDWDSPVPEPLIIGWENVGQYGNILPDKSDGIWTVRIWLLSDDNLPIIPDSFWRQTGVPAPSPPENGKAVRFIIYKN